MDKYICPKLPNIFVQFSIPAVQTSPSLFVQLPELYYHCVSQYLLYFITHTKSYMLSIVILNCKYTLLERDFDLMTRK